MPYNSLSVLQKVNDIDLYSFFSRLSRIELDDRFHQLTIDAFKQYKKRNVANTCLYIEELANYLCQSRTFFEFSMEQYDDLVELIKTFLEDFVDPILLLIKASVIVDSTRTDENVDQSFASVYRSFKETSNVFRNVLQQLKPKTQIGQIVRCVSLTYEENEDLNTAVGDAGTYLKCAINLLCNISFLPVFGGETPISNPRMTRDYDQYPFSTKIKITCYTTIDKLPERLESRIRYESRHRCGSILTKLENIWRLPYLEHYDMEKEPHKFLTVYLTEKKDRFIVSKRYPEVFLILIPLTHLMYIIQYRAWEIVLEGVVDIEYDHKRYSVFVGRY